MMWTTEHYLRFGKQFFIAHIPVIIFLLLIYLFLPFHIGVIGLVILFFIFTDTKASFEQYAHRYSFENNPPKTENITDQNPSMPDILVSHDETLKNFGFKAISQTQAIKANESWVVWEYFSEEDKTFADMATTNSIEMPAIVIFTTWYEGPRIIETRYPHGMTHDEDDWQVMSISDSLEATYNYHMQQVAKMSDKFGNPVTNQSNEELERLYREHFISRYMISGYNLYQKILMIKRLNAASGFAFMYYFIYFVTDMTLLMSGDPEEMISSPLHMVGLIISTLVFAITMKIWLSSLTRGKHIEKAKTIATS